MKSLILGFILLFSVLESSAQTAVPKTIVGGVVNGKALELPKPEYPAAARALCASGTVGVRVIIDESGTVISAESVSGHPLLRSASEKAALTAKFSPTSLSGQPVKVSGLINYVFNVKEDSDCGAPNDKLGEKRTVQSILFGEESSEKIEFLEIGAVFRMIQKLNSEERMDPVTNLMFNEIKNEFNSPDFPKEIEFMKELGTANRERRAEILALLYSMLRGIAEGNQIQAIAIGEQVGELMAESLKRGAIVQTDVNQTKLAILKLKDMLLQNGSAVEKKFLVKIKEIIEFSEKNNLDDPKYLSEVDSKIQELGDIIFEESEG